ncbi:MAG: chlorophyll a/b-binding protein [bacterium]
MALLLPSDRNMIATISATNTRAFVAKAAAPISRRAIKATRVFSAEEDKAAAPVEAAPAAEAPKVEPTPVAQPSVTAAMTATPTLGEAMAFSGAIPEVVNGRLAMVAIVAALAAEFSSEESVVRQFADAPAPILALVALTTVASFFPVLKGAAKDKSFGMFTPAVEMANGRAAMLGLAALLVIEGGLHHALF